MKQIRDTGSIGDRLIVALDVPSLEAARGLVSRLGAPVSFYKIGMWLFFLRGVDALIDELISAGKRVFLDYKMYDIPETVRRGVVGAASRGISIVTVHGDPEIMAAAVDGRGASGLRVFAISVLTSQDDAALREMGYAQSVAELVALRVRQAGRAGCDGVIASAADDPDAIRLTAGRPELLVGTPGIRLAGAETHDQKRAATPAAAIARGADYLVVGRPITGADDPRGAAETILAQMREGAAARARGGS